MKIAAIKSLMALLCAFLLLSCAEKRKDFVLQGELINSRSAERAYLYRFLREYGRVELLDSADVHKSRFVIKGDCDNPAEAYIRFDKEGEIYGFILSADDLYMEIGQNSYAVTGTADNVSLSQLMMKHHQGVNARKAILKEYSKLVADSTLTAAMEDSLLNQYRSYPVDLRQSVASVIRKSMDNNNVLLADLVFRTMYFALSQPQCDSIASALDLVSR